MKKEDKKEKKKTGIPRLLEISDEKKGLLVLGSVLSTVNVFLNLVPYLSIYKIMVELFENARNMSLINTGYLMHWAVIAIVAIVVSYVFMYFGGMLTHVAAYRTLYSIRKKLTRHISDLPLGWFNKNSIGKVKQIVEEDVELIETFIAHQFPDVVNTVVLLLVMVVVMFFLNPILALACIVPIIVGFAVQFSMMFGEKANVALKEYYDALENINSSSIQYIHGMPSIKIFGQTVHSFRQFYKDIIHYRDFSVKYADDFEPVYCIFRVLVLSLGTFILTAGVFLLSKDPLNMAFAITLLSFLIFAPGISMPVFKFNNLGQAMSSINEGVKRIDEILAEEVIKETKEPLKPLKYDIKFEKVSFAYDDKKTVLDNISFTAKQNEITAIVGPSGSGKSTIAQLIPRFYDIKKGLITIGDISLKHINTKNLMESMSFVFQDSFLFSDTVFNNIAVGKKDATKEEVVSAAKAAQCHEFITELPYGYDTMIGSDGVYLSGGEQQRISVARAILKNAPILILDEATAYADPENERSMQLALQELIKNKTVLIIAHRLNTIKNADKIIVLNNGKIENTGKHEELIKDSKTYRHMWEAYNSSSDWNISLNRKEGSR